MNQEVQNINEVLKEHKELEALYKKMETVEFSKATIGTTYGLAYTSSNSQYYILVKVVAVNPRSVRIQDDRGYTWAVNKATIKNRLFYPFADLPRLNELETAIRDYMEGKINEFWKKRIAAAEEEQKKEGVFVESETFKIDFTYPNYLRPISKNYGIRV